MPLGLLDTMPPGVPVVMTVSMCVGVTTSNVAVTFTGAVMVNAHVGEVEQPAAPDQPVKVVPVGAEAVRRTAVPLVYTAVQVVPQSMPVGELET